MEKPEGFLLPPRPPKRRHKQRTVYSVEQGKELERFFQSKYYPSYNERETLVARLNLQEQQVLVWFKNCRAKQSRLQRATSTKQPGPKARASFPSPGVCACTASCRIGPAFPNNPGSTSGLGLSEEPELPWELLLSQDSTFFCGLRASRGRRFLRPLPRRHSSRARCLQPPAGPTRTPSGCSGSGPRCRSSSSS